MHFTREIHRLINGLLVLFGIVAICAAYWATIGSNTILLRQDNPRLVQAESRIKRGDIVDRNGTTLVTSTENPDGEQSRHYIYPEMSSALGYSSIRYGVGGAEAAFNISLRGDNTSKDFFTQISDNILHHQQIGADIRLTFDLNIQRQAITEMGTHTGSIVVLDIPSGQVLSMVSLPSYDPNSLDQNWETLSKAVGNPFFNRAIQGAYQPGTVLQTPLMASALLANYPIDNPIPNATQSVQVESLTIHCVTSPQQSTLTLKQAYAYGCPYPFANLVQELGIETIQAGFNTFQLNEPATLQGYVVKPTEDSIDQTRFQFGTPNFIDNVLGQGSITVNPLEMAVIVAAIFNDGNAPSPYTLLQTRLPNTDGWIEDQSSHVYTPILTANSARTMQTIMEEAVTYGAAKGAAQQGLAIGGHAAIAYVGKTEQSWFIGYVRTGTNTGAAIAVILEDTRDAELAAQIGGRVLASAHQLLSAN